MEFPSIRDLKKILPWHITCIVPSRTNKFLTIRKPKGLNANSEETSTKFHNSDQNQEALKSIINEMGKKSAIAQNLNDPITTYGKLLNSNHKLYTMRGERKPDNCYVIGILKVGLKNLFLTDGDTPIKSPRTVICVLDFFVCEPLQRQGFGRQLYESMLMDLTLTPKELAVDRPSEMFLEFMKRCYNLVNFIKQPNNYVVYREFFDSTMPDKIYIHKMQSIDGEYHADDENYKEKIYPAGSSRISKVGV